MFWLSLPATKTARPPTFYTSHSKSEKKRPTEKLKKKVGIYCVSWRWTVRPCRAWLTTRSTTFVLYVYEYECDACSALRQPWYLNEGLVARGSSAGTKPTRKQASRRWHACAAGGVVQYTNPNDNRTQPWGTRKKEIPLYKYICFQCSSEFTMLRQNAITCEIMGRIIWISIKH